MSHQIIHADCIEAMREMDEASIDAIVTDPPYGLEFMGKEWDRLWDGRGDEAEQNLKGYVGSDGVRRIKTTAFSQNFSRPSYRAGLAAQEWHQAWATEALRVLKPGGHLLAFGGTRTSHRLVCAIEDAGFEIRDTIAWLYGSGFPKSHNLNGDGQGWGTALKPAHEPIVVARKPLVGTVAANVLEHGTGALNVDGCRIIGAPRTTHVDGNHTGAQDGKVAYSPLGEDYRSDGPTGRWPANVVLNEEAAALLDEQTGMSTSRMGNPRQGANGNGWGMTATGAEYADSGGASRFFYVAKASRAERNAGLGGFEEKSPWTSFDGQYAEGRNPKTGERTGEYKREQGNHHPTVKPIDLMRWLVRLVTPPGGRVLDPFTGSGTTGCAAVLEGFDFIGIERGAEYVAIAEARIAHWSKQPMQLELS